MVGARNNQEATVCRGIQPVALLLLDHLRHCCSLPRIHAAGMRVRTADLFGNRSPSMIRTNSPATPRAVHRTAARNNLRPRTRTSCSASRAPPVYPETGREYGGGIEAKR